MIKKKKSFAIAFNYLLTLIVALLMLSLAYYNYSYVSEKKEFLLSKDNVINGILEFRSSYMQLVNSNNSSISLSIPYNVEVKKTRIDSNNYNVEVETLVPFCNNYNLISNVTYNFQFNGNCISLKS